MMEFVPFQIDMLTGGQIAVRRYRPGMACWVLDRKPSINANETYYIPKDMAPHEFAKGLRRVVAEPGQRLYIDTWAVRTRHMTAPEFRQWLADLGLGIEATTIHFHREVQSTEESNLHRGKLMSGDWDKDTPILDAPPNEAWVGFSYDPQFAEMLKQRRAFLANLPEVPE